MKTTFKTLFHELEDDVIGIEESTVCENTGVSSEAVKRNVMAHLGLHKKRKTFGKTFRMTLIAAVLSAALIIGTTVIGANGGMELLKEFFTGMVSSSDLYHGGNVEVATSDPNLQVELLAVTGDQNNFYAVIRAEKKDGTAFTDEGYLYSDHITSPYIGVVCCDQAGKYYPRVNDNTVKKCRLSDDRKTLYLFLSLDLSSLAFKNYPDIGNGIMTVKCDTIGFMKIKEKLAVYDRIDVEVHDEFLKTAEEKNLKDWTWLETPEGIVFCTVEKKEYAIPFEMTFSMKHNTDNTIHQTLSMDSAPHFIKSTAENVRMEISPFNIRISCDGKRSSNQESPIEDIWYLSDLCFERVAPDNSQIILDDGTAYYFEVIPWGNTEYQNPDEEGVFDVHVELKLRYTSIPNPTYIIDDVVVDTSRIKQIILNGDTIYKK